MDNPEEERVTLLGITNFRDMRRKFGIKKRDRRYHMYVIGKTGTGKTTLLEQMISQDIQRKEGLAVFDPHGDFLENVVKRIPEERKADVIYFNVPDPTCPFGFNPLANIPAARKSLAASEIVEALKKIWEKTWGVRMEYILMNTLLTLLDQPNSTLADITRLFTDNVYRKEALTRVSNTQVLEFWEKVYSRWTSYYKTEAVFPIQNKVGHFLSDPLLHGILTKKENNLDFRKIMDEGKILLVNLAKGKLGPGNSSLLGSLLVASIGLTALSRADIPEKERKDFYLYLDEFQNFTTLSMATMLSELRKYRLNLIISHQYLDQLEEDIRNAVFGNVGTIISFRIGLKDARILEREFYPEFSETDLINLPNYNVYIKMMIDGAAAKPFSADTLPPMVVIGSDPEFRQTISRILMKNNYHCLLAVTGKEGLELIKANQPRLIFLDTRLPDFEKFVVGIHNVLKRIRKKPLRKTEL